MTRRIKRLLRQTREHLSHGVMGAGESRKGVKALRTYETDMIGFLELVIMAKHGLRMQWQEHIFESARFPPPTRVNMDIVCPSCQERLKELGSSGKFFRCSKEDILWELCEDIGGRHLRTYYTPSGYKGPMIAGVSIIPCDESKADDR